MSRYLKDLIEYQKKEIHELKALLEQAMEREIQATGKREFTMLDIKDRVYLCGYAYEVYSRDWSNGTVTLALLPPGK